MQFVILKMCPRAVDLEVKIHLNPKRTVFHKINSLIFDSMVLIYVSDAILNNDAYVLIEAKED